MVSGVVHRNALPMGSRINEYVIEGILGEPGGFGIAYLARDVNLDQQVAIKEYLPNDLAMREGTTVYPKSAHDEEDYQWGLERFLDEAKTLAKFPHPNIVQVLRYFEANSTGYMVMRYEDGLPLNEILKKGNSLTEEELTQNILFPLLDGLKKVHAGGFLHRDIKPGNIYMRRSDETPVLLDFGAARNALGSKSKSLTSIVTPGYAPFEQYYGDGNQGPWSDIYALGAVAYRIVTGEQPAEAPKRMKNDPLIPAVEVAKGKYSEHLLKAIDHALEMDEEDRPQSCEEWRQELSGQINAEPEDKKVDPPQPAKKDKKAKQSESGGQIVGDVPQPPEKKKPTIKIVLAVIVVLIVGAIAIPQMSHQSKQLHQTEGTQQQVEKELATSNKAKEVARNKVAEEQAIKDALHSIQTEMVTIPSGSFMMGSNDEDSDEKPVHRVHINSFKMGKYEVTQPLWQAVMGKNPSRFKGENRPVENVSWNDIQTFIRKLNSQTGKHFRLPSEAEWEYAARAGSTTKYSWGDSAGHNLANCDGCGSQWDKEKTAPVGSFSANKFGLYDMHGNVWEWVQDRWHDSYNGAPNDGSAWVSGSESYRVLRGGSWLTDPYALRLAVRYTFSLTTRVNGFGFRLVQDTILTNKTVAEPSQPATFPLTIKTTPSDATVMITNIKPKYQAGMALVAGRYQLKVSAPGYETFRGYADLSASSPHTYTVTLKKKKISRIKNTIKDIEFVTIPSGSFMMGSNSGNSNEAPVHKVRIKSFKMSKYEITQSQWKSVMGNNPSSFKGGNQPVENVTWNDVQHFIRKLNSLTGKHFRLPSEGEWEYAARAGSRSKYSFEGGESNLCRYGNVADLAFKRVFSGGTVANCDDGYPEITAAVGQFQSNGFGLYDMHGNVSEWLQDCYHESYRGAPSGGSAWTSGKCDDRVMRGGSWTDAPFFVRSASRSHIPPDIRDRNVGFRLVLE